MLKTRNPLQEVTHVPRPKEVRGDREVPCPDIPTGGIAGRRMSKVMHRPLPVTRDQ